MKQICLLLFSILLITSGCTKAPDGNKNQIDNTQIHYTTTNGERLFPNITEPACFGAILLSNTYENGIGILTFDSAITSIGDSAFKDCSSLESIIIPDSVTSTGNSAFKGCTSLINVNLGNGITLIGENCFENCSSIVNPIIPDSVTSIGERAFKKCTSIKNITLSKSITSLGESAFENCSKLETINLPDSAIKIGEYAFWGCTSLPTENNIIYADYYTVGVVDNTLTTYEIKNGATVIGSETFAICRNATNIIIPNSVTKISRAVFYQCENLEEITIPENVNEIGDHAFSHCTNLLNVYCKPTTPPIVDYYLFDHNVFGRKIHVPIESVSAYTSTANWNTYTSEIVGYKY